MKLQYLNHKNVHHRLLSLLTFRPYARYLARQMGYELVGENEDWWRMSGYKLFSRRLPALFQNGSADPYYYPVKVDIASITSRVGFSYAKDGWHPFVQTLKEYCQDPSLPYEESSLARLYQQYQPENVQAVLLDHVQEPLRPFCDWPASNELISWVWTWNQHSIRSCLKSLRKKNAPQGWILFGPHHQEYGRKEFQRLTGVYESIKKNGYQSGLSQIDPVNGYFLKNGTEVRFVLLQGNHRVSALKMLGYSSVEVLIRQGHPAVVDRADLHRWTEEGGGIYPSCLAESLFDTLFNGSGREKAKRYGLSG